MRGILYKNVKEDKGIEKNEDKRKNRAWSKFKKVLEKMKNALVISAVSTSLLFSTAAAKAEEQKAGESVKQQHGFFDDLSYGFHYYNNDAGSSLFGELDITDWLGLTAGGIWLDQTPYGIASMNLAPKIGFWNDTLVLNYFGNITGTHMASYLYTSHGAGASGHFDIGDFRINLATLGQLGISYPRYDLLFAKWMNAISLSYDINEDHKLGMYAINTNMWAASKTPKTAFAMDYAPRYQGTEVGIRYNYRTHSFNAYTNIDAIEPYTGIGYGKKLAITDLISVNAFIGGGIRGYNTPFFPLGFYVYGGVEASFEPTEKRERQNTFSVRFENRNIKPSAAYDKQLVHELGDITPEQREWINKTQTVLSQSDTFAGFAAAYEGASISELLTVANYLGSLLGRGGYDYGAYNDMMEFRIFSPRVKELSERNYDDILRFLRDYSAYYREHGTYDGMPEELKRGVAVCAGIHEFVAEFLRANGITAYAIGVVTKNAPHVVAVAFYDDKASIIDYGRRYDIKSSSLDDVLKVYSMESGVPVLQSQIFGKGGKYLGTYTTPQGRLVENTMKTSGRRLIANMLNQGPKKQKHDGPIEITVETVEEEIEEPIMVPLKAETKEEKTVEQKQEQGDKKQEDDFVPSLVPIVPQGSEQQGKEGADAAKPGKTGKVAMTTDLPEIKIRPPRVRWPTFNEAMDKVARYIRDHIKNRQGISLSKITFELTVNKKEGKIISARITEPQNMEKDIERKIMLFILSSLRFEKDKTLKPNEPETETKLHTIIIGQQD